MKHNENSRVKIPALVSRLIPRYAQISFVVYQRSGISFFVGIFKSPINILIHLILYHKIGDLSIGLSEFDGTYEKAGRKISCQPILINIFNLREPQPSFRTQFEAMLKLHKFIRISSSTRLSIILSRNSVCLSVKVSSYVGFVKKSSS